MPPPLQPQPPPGSAALHAGSLQRVHRAKLTADTTVVPIPSSARRPATARSAKPQPELLAKLLCFIRTELHAVGHDPEGRLEVFRRAWNHFISAFGSYAPLLLAIQQAYEDSLRRATGAAADVDLLRARMATMQSESAQLIEELRLVAQREQDELQRKARLRDSSILNTERQMQRLQLELANTQLELSHTKAKAAELEARNAEMTTRIEYMQAEASEARRLLHGDGSEVSLT